MAQATSRYQELNKLRGRSLKEKLINLTNDPNCCKGMVEKREIIAAIIKFEDEEEEEKSTFKHEYIAGCDCPSCVEYRVKELNEKSTKSLKKLLKQFCNTSYFEKRAYIEAIIKFECNLGPKAYKNYGSIYERWIQV